MIRSSSFSPIDKSDIKNLIRRFLSILYTVILRMWFYALYLLERIIDNDLYNDLYLIKLILLSTINTIKYY